MAYREAGPNHYRRSAQPSRGSALRGLAGSGPPGSLLWTPPLVKINGIPSPISAPAPNPATWRRIPIASGSLGTSDTLRAMAGLAIEAVTDPWFVNEARSVVRGIPSKDYKQEADAMLQFAKEQVDYREDPIAPGLVNWIPSPGYLLGVDNQTNCAGLTVLLCALDLAIGKMCLERAVAVDPDFPGIYSHVFPVVYIGGVPYAQDAVPTPARLGWEPPESEWTAPAMDYPVIVQ